MTAGTACNHFKKSDVECKIVNSSTTPCVPLTSWRLSLGWEPASNQVQGEPKNLVE